MSSRKNKKNRAASQDGANHSDNRQDAIINLGEAERQASMVGGTVLAVCGLLRGSLSGLALAAIGAALVYRGHTGHCQLYAALDHSTADEHHEAMEARGPRPELQGSHQHS
jgi:uncharacterized membrane protein